MTLIQTNEGYILASPKFLSINRHYARHIDSGYNMEFTLKEQFGVKIDHWEKSKTHKKNPQLTQANQKGKEKTAKKLHLHTSKVICNIIFRGE